MRAIVASLLLAAAASARAVTNEFGVIFCHASVSNASGSAACLAIALPATSGFSDTNGNPVAVWDVGNVVAGGTADTFHSENGPGAFQARNVGNRAAYVYVTSGYPLLDDGNSTVDGRAYYADTLRGLFGDSGLHECTADFEGSWDPWGYAQSYRVAVSTSVDTKFPVWRNLEWLYYRGMYTDGDGNGPSSSYDEEMYMGWMHFPSFMKDRLAQRDYYNYYYNGYVDLPCGVCGQYLGFLLPGEEVPFDLKLWAPAECENSIGFIVRLEASTFRRWRHGKQP